MTVEISRRWSLLDCVWWPGITAHQLVEQMLPCIRSTAQYPAVSFNLSVFSFFKAILDIYIYIYIYTYISLYLEIYIYSRLEGTKGFKIHSVCHCGADYFPEFIAKLQGCGASMESGE